MHTHFYSATKLSQASYDFVSHSLIMWHGRDRRGWRWQPSQLTPAAADERCVDVNIFVSTRSTVCVHRHLQRTGILSYHRRRRQQMRSRTRRRAFVDASASIYARMRSNVLTRTCRWTHLCEFTDAFMETFLSAHLCCTVCAVSYYSPRQTAGGKDRGGGCHTGV